MLRACLDIFGSTSGLFTNLVKCVPTPINCSGQDLALVQQVMGCKIGDFTYRYLGVPLSVYKLCRSEEQFLIDAVASRIPTWKGNLLNLAGRMTLVKITLSAIPVHMSILVCLSPWAIEAIDKRQASQSVHLERHRNGEWRSLSGSMGDCCRPRTHLGSVAGHQ